MKSKICFAKAFMNYFPVLTIFLIPDAMTPFKRIIAYILTGLVLLFAIVTLLGVWGFIDLEDLFIKMFKSVVVILATAAIIVFIFAILIRENEHKHDI
jgi:hypothetical protein